ncbi:hypothetical protein BDQ12DRAFT_355718 [Crucibulum laeve]|uniref:Annexin n=1 Tax=Crucibulum laeve TaxID=68775 RepID=A0A5C3MEA5_9AGAR|nr:hypothetical protein BDQ12DRAFT_355718 [Crucibulum laeve]
MMPQPAYAPQTPYGHIMFLGVPVPDPAAPRQPPAQQVPGFDFAATKASIDKTKKMMSIDEKTLIEVMLSLTIPQMHALDSYIRELKKESLVKYLKDLIGMKSSSAFTAVICALAAGPIIYDAELVFQAVDGIGTNEEKLNEVLLTRDHQEIVALRKAYEDVLQEKKKDGKRTLYSDVEKDLSGVDWDLFRGAIETQRLPENAQPVDHARVQADYAALMNAITDKAELFKILNNAPKNHLAAVYQTGVENGINLNSKDHFKSRFSADKDLRDSLRYLFGAVTSMKAYDGLYGIRQDAELLTESDEKQLTYRIVRGHWNAKRWAAVKEQFQSTKGVSLEDYVKKKTSGSLEDILVALVRKK